MELVIRIQCDNAAFGETAFERSAEISDILGQASRKIIAGYAGGVLRDGNGNMVGSFEFDIPTGD